MKIKLSFFQLLLCIAIILTGILASINLYYMFSRTSDVYGDYNNPNTNYVNYFYTSIHDLHMDNNDGVFTQVLTADPVEDFDAIMNSYVVKINDVKWYNVQANAGKLSISYQLDFKDSEANVISSTPLMIELEMLSSKTTITLTIKGTQTDVDLWSTYINITGLRIEVLKVNEV